MSGLVWAVKNGDMDQVKRLVEEQVIGIRPFVCVLDPFEYRSY